MDSRIKKLRGANMDIDFSNEAYGDSRCPWNEAEKTEDHRCAVKSTSICPYFCGVQFLDSVFCSYPDKNVEILTAEEIDRDRAEIS